VCIQLSRVSQRQVDSEVNWKEKLELFVVVILPPSNRLAQLIPSSAESILKPTLS